MTQQEKENISQLIMSKEMHDLGIQQAKLHRYDVLCEYDYKLDLLSYKALFRKNYTNRVSLTICGDWVDRCTIEVDGRENFEVNRIYINDQRKGSEDFHKRWFVSSKKNK